MDSIGPLAATAEIDLENAWIALDLLDGPLAQHRPRAERGEHARRGAAKGQLDVVPYGEVHEHRRRLELPADAELGDLVLAKREKVRVVAEDHAAALGLHASGDDVEQGGLARAVRADD